MGPDRPVLSKYERAKVMSARMQQINNGAEPMVPTTPGDTLEQTAERELLEGVMPFKLVRSLPDGTRRVYRLADMVICAAPSAPTLAA